MNKGKTLDERVRYAAIKAGRTNIKKEDYTWRHGGYTTVLHPLGHRLNIALKWADYVDYIDADTWESLQAMLLDSRAKDVVPEAGKGRMLEVLIMYAEELERLRDKVDNLNKEVDSLVDELEDEKEAHIELYEAHIELYHEIDKLNDETLLRDTLSKVDLTGVHIPDNPNIDWVNRFEQVLRDNFSTT